jgi:hypothetical protein
MLHEALKNYLDAAAVIVSERPKIGIVLLEVIAQQAK